MVVMQVERRPPQLRVLVVVVVVVGIGQSVWLVTRHELINVDTGAEQELMSACKVELVALVSDREE